MLSPHRSRIALLAAAGLSVLALAACDSVALEGKVFDWMGISGNMDKARDPKMAERAPLVVPPNTARLPEPGSGKTDGEAIASLKDPELTKAAAAKERERLHLAYCRGEIQWKDRAFDPDNPKANRSPYGPCPGLLSGVLGSVNKE